MGQVESAEVKQRREDLLFACSEGKLDSARELIKAGADVDSADKIKGATPLLLASRYGHKDLVRLLCDSGAALEAADRVGATPLWWACSEGHMEIALLLMDKGAALKADRGENTPLHVAVRNGHKDIVLSLLEKGSSVGAANKNGDAALHIASHCGHKDLVDLLCARGAAVNTANKNGDTPLHVASHHGHKDIVDLLCAKGAALEAANKDGNTPLWWASYKGYTDIVMSLLEKGASVDAAYKTDSVTALCIAKLEGHKECAQLLLDRGADCNKAANGLYRRRPLDSLELDVIVEVISRVERLPDLRNFFRCSKRLLALSKEESVQAAWLYKHQKNYVITYGYRDCQWSEKRILGLLQGDWPESRAVRSRQFSLTGKHVGGNFLQWACEYGHILVAKEVLAHGSDVVEHWGSCHLGKSPLMHACGNGHKDIVQLLLGKGADVERADAHESTPLIYATRSKNPDKDKDIADIVRALCSEGADVNKANMYGWTPLYCAAVRGHLPAVKELLAHGADVNEARVDVQAFLLEKLGLPRDYHAQVEHCMECELGCSLFEENSTASSPDSLAQDGLAKFIMASHGADEDALKELRKDGMTALMMAAIGGHVGVMKELLAHGASVNHADPEGQTPLFSAILEGHLEAVKVLLAHGASVDHACKVGRTPLYLASSRGHKSVVEELLGHGASVDLEAKESQVWIDVVCDMCDDDKQIVGPRYKGSAENYDLCERCAKSLDAMSAGPFTIQAGPYDLVRQVAAERAALASAQE